MSVKTYGDNLTIDLPRDSVSHWSVAMYGHTAGYIAPFIEASPENPLRPIQLNLHTPGGKAAPGIHGGARRVDINLTREEAAALGQRLIDLAKRTPR